MVPSLSALQRRGWTTAALLALGCGTTGAAPSSPSSDARGAQTSPSRALHEDGTGTFGHSPGTSATAEGPGSRLRPDPAPAAEARRSEPSGEPTGCHGLDPSSDPFVRLPVDGRRAAVVSLPLGSVDARPLVVATHGAGGRPEPHCGLWRRIVGNRAFVLCPAGSPTHPHLPEPETGYFYPGHPALAAEVSAAIEALRARFGACVDVVDPIYVGYSQGATMGALVLPSHPASFARAALVEGGSGEAREWNVAVARRFAEHGGRRVLLACGRPACARAARETKTYLELGGLEARVVYAEGVGHSYGGKMESALSQAFGWLVRGDARW